ncbi:4-hydroxybenzoate octaprenyltransferase [Pirellulimonas nuda]|uniref:4-hydroxybenzoate polyprenyltransferase n=1 Tax=Pirellulimonas nuda TaxID=2528009 RepID=A0A518D9H0_9BACT|nr:UbiA-like polyprenyltransferase [Pirellulimonas nuda]QDU88130.1 4-hydroxybenzoate octaprenyltransferase [Pirellulimonas nuda]
MLQVIRHFLSLIRFSHTVFALPFALMSAVMAWWLRAWEDTGIVVGTPIPGKVFGISAFGGHSLGHIAGGARVLPNPLENIADAIRWQELLGILLCMVFARSTAMAFNRLVDRRIDGANPRTVKRHLPAGILTVGQVASFAVVSAALFIASTLLFRPNRLPLYLSAPVLLVLLGYSYAKRFTALAHVWLGLALALAPVAAWIAIRGEAVMTNPLDLLPALVLGAAVLFWVTGFDVIYACQDAEFDRAAGLHSIPAKLGVRGALRLAAACHVLTVLALAALPLVYPPLGWLYWTAVGGVALLLAYEHAIVRPNDLDRVNVAFFNVNAVISLGLLAVVCVDLLI